MFVRALSDADAAVPTLFPDAALPTGGGRKCGTGMEPGGPRSEGRKEPPQRYDNHKVPCKKLMFCITT